jgi:hypothetical protein
MEKMIENIADKKISELEKYLCNCPENINMKEAMIILQKILGYDSQNHTKKYEPLYNIMLNKLNDGGKINKNTFKKALTEEIRSIYSPHHYL